MKSILTNLLIAQMLYVIVYFAILKQFNSIQNNNKKKQLGKI